MPVLSVAASTLCSIPLSLALLVQSGDPLNTSYSTLHVLEVFTGLVALAMLVIALVVGFIGYGLLKAKREVDAHLAEFKGKAYPLIEKSHALVTDLTPEIKAITAKTNEIMAKVDVITAHAESIAALAKQKAEEFSPTVSAANETAKQANETVRETNQKVREQVTRINSMVTDTLDATTRLGKAIERGIAMPGREIAGLVAGAKATAEHLMQNSSGFGSLLGRLSNLFSGKPNSPAGSTRTSQSYRSMSNLPAASQVHQATRVPSPDQNSPRF